MVRVTLMSGYAGEEMCALEDPFSSDWHIRLSNHDAKLDEPYALARTDPINRQKNVGT